MDKPSSVMEFIYYYFRYYSKLNDNLKLKQNGNLMEFVAHMILLLS